jgi:hypothetical protein
MNAQFPVPKASLPNASVGDTITLVITSEDEENFMLEAQAEMEEAPVPGPKRPKALEMVMDA